ncbi:MAG: MMPL family transporter [Thermogutta sp.]|nr:MMPL family transporter [Thermogutta sp.]
MSQIAERESVLDKLSIFLVRTATIKPVVTLIVGSVCIVAAAAIGYHLIEFHTSRADLLNPHSEYHQRWLRYVGEFGDQEDVYVVVEGDSPREIEPVLTELAEALRAQPQHFQHIMEGFDAGRLAAKGLYFIPKEELDAIPPRLDRLESVAAQAGASADPGEYLHRLLEQGRALAGADQTQVDAYWHEVEKAFAATAAVLAGKGPELLARHQLGAALPVGEDAHPQGGNSISVPAGSAVAGGGDGSPGGAGEEARGLPAGRGGGDAGAAVSAALNHRRLFSPDGKLGLIVLRFVPDSGTQFARFAERVAALRETLQIVQQRHPQVRLGATGLPVLEFDEMQASGSSGIAAGAALLGVVLVFVAGFGGFRYPAMITISLITAVAWTCGYVAFAVGHLNILTSAFGAMLIGLGDYGVHFVAHYVTVRKEMRGTRAALLKTAATVGGGIATGAVTTAAAFFAGALTDFLGVAELGIIAGGGILLCWLADMTVLPAMICLVDRKPSAAPGSLVDLSGWFRPLHGLPQTGSLVLVLATVALACGLPMLRYDYNLLNLQPQGLPSVEFQNKLVEHMSRSSYFALSVADSPEIALARKEQFLRLPTVDHVEEIVSLIPPDAAEREPAVRAIAERLKRIEQRLSGDSAEALPGRLDAALSEWYAAASRVPALAEFARQIADLQSLLRQIPPEELARRLSALPRAVETALGSQWAALQQAADPEPPTLNDLPESLRVRFVGQNGRHLVQVYCKGDFWDPQVMRQFVADVRSVDPEATGNPIQIYEAARQMNRAYIEAALYAFVAIVLALYLDFRSLRDVGLVLIPLACGMAGLFGLMGYLDIPLNPANMITLPLILGIGIDDGVHIIHDFRRQKGRYLAPQPSTLTAVVVNTLTTLVGFGALMLSPHQGLQSLGRVLTLGMATCLTAALLLPSLLRVLSGWQGPAEGESREGPAEIETVLAETLFRGQAGGDEAAVEPAASEPAERVAVRRARDETAAQDDPDRAAA